MTRLYCECPENVIDCPAAWFCDDIEAHSIEILAYYESNGDYAINP
jgi:hypothetical protein